jgi:hypothetical protein
MDMFLHNHKNIIKVFKGSCIGVVLEKREDWENPNDPHICFFIIHEDDGNWFESKTGHTSSSWIDDMIKQLQLARAWMDEFCTMSNYGWDYHS